MYKRQLLLSATPYKLYFTLEEIDENQLDEHYAEFFQVMNFLLDRKSTRLNSSHRSLSRMPSSA